MKRDFLMKFEIRSAKFRQKQDIQRLLLQKSLKSLEKLAPLKIERKVVDLLSLQKMTINI